LKEAMIFGHMPAGVSLLHTKPGVQLQDRSLGHTTHPLTTQRLSSGPN